MNSMLTSWFSNKTPPKGDETETPVHTPETDLNLA